MGNENSNSIRAISRSIAILQTINRLGSASLIELTCAVDLPYATVWRIIQTLVQEGLIESEPTRKKYKATALVQSLSIGFHNHGRLVSVCRPHIHALTRKISWPVSVNTHVGQWMIIRDSTYSETSLTFTNYLPGHTFPILESATGQVYLAFVSHEERAAILKGIEALEGRSPMLSMFESDTLIRRIRDDGYAAFDRSRHTPTPGKTSSVSVPIFERGKAVAALTLTVFSSSMQVEEALRRYLADLRQTAAHIGTALDQEAGL